MVPVVAVVAIGSSVSNRYVAVVAIGSSGSMQTSSGSSR